MSRGLASDVIDFLLDHPEELKHVMHRMQDVEERRTRPMREHAEQERRAALPLKPCTGLLGRNECGNETPGGFMCDDCNAEFSSDPAAYK
jgi:hypothetical protein